MSIVINTNLASLNAQRQLHSTSSQMATTLQRLSSGLRINSAKDDAAGLSIAERMTTQVRGLNQGIRNVADGVSLAQTAEGGLESITNNLQRIRELAVQSANFTNSSADRAAIQLEVVQLQEEITRVANQTVFNGTKLLNGSLGTASFQVGANVGETVDIRGVADSRAAALGKISVKEGLVVAAAPHKDLSVGGWTYDLLSTSVKDLAKEINALGVEGLYAYVDPSDSAKLGLAYSGSSEVVYNDSGVLGSEETITEPGNAKYVNAIDVTNSAGANKAILSVDAALSTVNGSRARLGAAMNRFDAAISSQRITSEAVTASRSRIEDADFAQETAALTRAQILQQSGMAILSQANALPQNVLSLLR